jgi:hypothetical protein
MVLLRRRISWFLFRFSLTFFCANERAPHLVQKTSSFSGLVSDGLPHCGYRLNNEKNLQAVKRCIHLGSSYNLPVWYSLTDREITQTKRFADTEAYRT